MKKYKQLTHKERYQIYALIKEGFNYTQIANNIGYSKSTISREIKPMRNGLENSILGIYEWSFRENGGII